MQANGRSIAAAAALLGYFVSFVAAASLILLNVGFVCAVLVRGGNVGNPDDPGWFAFGVALLVMGAPLGLASAWCIYRNRVAHLFAIPLGLLAATLGGAFGAKFLAAANTAQSLGEGFGYTTFGMMLWSVAASGAAASLGGALGLMLEWLRNAMRRESTRAVLH